MILTSVPAVTPGAHRPEVGVEGAHGDRDALGQAKARGPFRAEPTRRPVERVRVVVESLAERREPRVEAGQELLRRQAAPGARVHRLVARGAHAPLDPARVAHAREQRRDEVGELDPAPGGLEHVGRDLQAAPDLRPEPLGRVDAADRSQVLRRVLARGARDGRRLVGPGVVLPQPGVGREVRLPAWVEGERSILPVHRDRRRARGVDSDPDDGVPREALICLGRRERSTERALQAEHVVGRVLAREVRVLRVEEHAALARRVVEDRRCRARARPRNRRRAHGRSWCRSRRRS